MSNKNIMPNLYFFPCIPDDRSGYGIAVKSDIKHLNLSNNDYVVYITENKIKNVKKSKHLFIYRNSISFRIINFISTGHPSFFSGFYIYILLKIYFNHTKYNKLFIGDVNFFYCLKYLKYRSADIRLHNLFLKINENLSFDYLKLQNLKIFYLSLVGASIENKILSKISKPGHRLFLITKQEKKFIETKYGINCSILSVTSSFPGKIIFKKIKNWDKKIVWLGGLSSHKAIGVDYFIDKIFPKLKELDSEIEFHLFGKGTHKINFPEKRIFGFGFVDNFDFNRFSNSIFINPDIIGGGTKLKLMNLYENGLTCISTDLGVEGFNFSHNWENLTILNIDNWVDYFLDISKSIS
jgi:hypothetical protein